MHSSMILAQLNNGDVGKVYLVTYSKADTDRFKCKSFAIIVRTAFQALIIQAACCMEHHMYVGVHFHMCVLLSTLQ